MSSVGVVFSLPKRFILHLNSLQGIWVTFLGKATSAIRAVLPIAISCAVFLSGYFTG